MGRTDRGKPASDRGWGDRTHLWALEEPLFVYYLYILDSSRRVLDDGSDLLGRRGRRTGEADEPFLDSLRLRGRGGGAGSAN